VVVTVCYACLAGFSRVGRTALPNRLGAVLTVMEPIPEHRPVRPLVAFTPSPSPTPTPHELEAKIDTLTIATNYLSCKEVVAVKSQVEVMEVKVDNARAEVATLQGDHKFLFGCLNELRDNVRGELSTKVDFHLRCLNELKADIGSVQLTTYEQDTRITDIVERVGRLEGQVNSHQTNLNHLIVRLNHLEATVQAFQNTQTANTMAVQKDLAELQRMVEQSTSGAAEEPLVVVAGKGRSAVTGKGR
jgi:hypothetical protein